MVGHVALGPGSVMHLLSVQAEQPAVLLLWPHVPQPSIWTPTAGHVADPSFQQYSVEAHSVHCSWPEVLHVVQLSSRLMHPANVMQ